MRELIAIHFLKPLDDGSYNFSFSGLKSAVINLKHNADQRGEEINGNDLACSFQDVAMDTIASKALAMLMILV